MDAQLITLETGWSPKYNMKKSIGEIVKWYLKNI
jgi:dTDP-D-glucose 4,6-dehydratase